MRTLIYSRTMLKSKDPLITQLIKKFFQSETIKQQDVVKAIIKYTGYSHPTAMKLFKDKLVGKIFLKTYDDKIFIKNPDFDTTPFL